MRQKRDQWSAVIAISIMVFIVAVVAGVRLFQTPSQALKSQVQPSDNSETVEARIVRVIHPTSQTTQMELEIVGGSLNGEQAQIEESNSEINSAPTYRSGDHVLINVATRPDGGHEMMITDYVRTGQLAFLTLLFVGFTIFVSGWKGTRSLVGLAISFVVLMGFVLPQILAGRDAVLISVVGAFVLLAATLYLTYGWSLMTHSALLGILVSLILIGLLSALAVALTRLDGSASEDALTLQAAGVSINLQGLLLAGIIIGTLGVLADVVVTQASTVMELADVNPSLDWRELYRRAMNIGRDHIAATVNTLVLAYVGAAMPLLLLFQLYPEPWAVTINRSFVAEEIVRTLVGSLGLVAAVPITTITTSLLRRWQGDRAINPPTNAPESITHYHSHRIK